MDGPADHELYDEGIAPWDGRRVPMTLLGGYLGSGKTTVLNELLRRTDRPLAVLVNDVGEVNIDAQLIRQRSGDTVELTDGCVCCSLADGLARALNEIRARPEPPDHVVLELSGLADPTQVLPWASSDGFRLDGVIVLADSTTIVEQLADERLRPLLLRQLDAADLIVASKSALVGPDRRTDVAAAIGELVPQTPVVDDADGTVGPTLLDIATRRPRDATALPQPQLLDVHQVELVTLPRPVTRNELDDILDHLPADTVRVKGIAETPDGKRLLIHHVGRRRRIVPLPTAEDQEPTDLVVIRLPEATSIRFRPTPK